MVKKKDNKKTTSSATKKSSNIKNEVTVNKAVKRPEPAEKIKKPLSVREREKLKKLKEKKEKEELKKQLKELNKRRAAKSKVSKSCQAVLPYTADYEGGVFEFKDGNKLPNYSMTMEIEDMNYQILSEKSGDDIITKYGKMFNSFSPGNTYQITIVKGETDQEAYRQRLIKTATSFDKMDTIRRERQQMILNSMDSSKTKRTKRIFLTNTISAPNQVEAFRNFRRIETQFENSFKNMGTKAKKLDTLERLEVFHDIFRPEWTGQFNRNGKLDYSKIVSDKHSTKDFICPDGLDFSKINCFTIGANYGQCLNLNNFPPSLSDRIIGDLIDIDLNIVITITINPYTNQDAIKMVRRRLNDMEADKIKQQKQAVKAGYDPEMINHDLKKNLENAEELLKSIQTENQKMYDVCVTIFHYAESYEELQQNYSSLKEVASTYLCHLSVLNGLQEPALVQTLPFGTRTIKELSIPMITESISGFIPFTSVELIEEQGFWYGTNQISKEQIKVNRTNLNNVNGFILGGSGSGKSMITKNEILEIMTNTEDEIIIIDPDDEYQYLCDERYFDAEYIELSEGSNTYFNIMDMDEDYGIEAGGDALKAKVAFLLTAFEEMIGDNNPLPTGRKGLLDKICREVYKEYIRHNYDEDYIPTLIDVQKQLEKYGEKDLDAFEMAKSLQLFSTGTLDFFAHKTTVKKSRRLTVYGIKRLGKTLRGLADMVMLDAVWNRVLKNREKGTRTWVYIDEFTVMTRRPSSKEFLLDSFKRIRKQGGACTGITQNITSILRDYDLLEMLNNSQFLIVLDQNDTDREELQTHLNFSEKQLEYVKNVGKGRGLMRVAGKVVPFENVYDKNTISYQMMTSDPKERAEIEKYGKILSVG